MKKSIKVILILVLALTFMFSLSLIACKDKDKPADIKISFMIGDKESGSINIAANGDVTFPDDPVVEGQVFEGWELEDGTDVNAEYFKNNPVTADLSLRAKLYYLNDFEYDSEKLAIKVNDEVTAAAIGITITNSYGESVETTATIFDGEQMAGTTMKVKIVATGKYDMKKEKIFTGIKVYGMPSLTYTAKTAIKAGDESIDASIFNALAKDSFNETLDVTTKIIGNYAPTETVKVQLSAMDAAGNNKIAEVNNVKVYGEPRITYDTTKTFIYANQISYSKAFNVVAKDSFNTVIPVTATLASGTHAAGSTITIKFSTTDAASNKTEVITRDVTIQEALFVRVNASNEPQEDGEYILFGEYPQTLKLASVTIPNPTTPEPNGYYLGSDGAYYAKVLGKPFESGYFFKDNTTEVILHEIYYFKVEPIKWRILTTNGDDVLILCESIIANRAYDPTNTSNNYKESNVRKWLINEFLTKAFNTLEQALIQAKTVDNSAASTGVEPNPNACDNTTDKIFLLSYAEAMNLDYGFKNRHTFGDTKRRKVPSDYSLATGTYMKIGNSYWWLRSPNAENKNVFVGNCYGIISNDENIEHTETGSSALWLDIG